MTTAADTVTAAIAACTPAALLSGVVAATSTVEPVGLGAMVAAATAGVIIGMPSAPPARSTWYAVARFAGGVVGAAVGGNALAEWLQLQLGATLAITFVAGLSVHPLAPVWSGWLQRRFGVVLDDVARRAGVHVPDDADQAVAPAPVGSTTTSRTGGDQ